MTIQQLIQKIISAPTTIDENILYNSEDASDLLFNASFVDQFNEIIKQITNYEQQYMQNVKKMEQQSFTINDVQTMNNLINKINNNLLIASLFYYLRLYIIESLEISNQHPIAANNLQYLTYLNMGQNMQNGFNPNYVPNINNVLQPQAQQQGQQFQGNLYEYNGPQPQDNYQQPQAQQQGQQFQSNLNEYNNAQQQANFQQPQQNFQQQGFPQSQASANIENSKQKVEALIVETKTQKEKLQSEFDISNIDLEVNKENHNQDKEVQELQFAFETNQEKNQEEHKNSLIINKDLNQILITKGIAEFGEQITMMIKISEDIRIIENGIFELANFMLSNEDIDPLMVLEKSYEVGSTATNKLVQIYNIDIDDNVRISKGKRLNFIKYKKLLITDVIKSLNNIEKGLINIDKLAKKIITRNLSRKSLLGSGKID